MKIAEVTLKYKTHVPVDNMAKIECPDDAVIILRSIWYEDTIRLQKEFVVILLNNAKKCLGWSKISIGGNNSSIVNPAHVMQVALLGNAQSLILAHNHPNGELKPSISDIHPAQRIVKAGKLLSIAVDDHIILSVDSYYSFKEAGDL